MDAWDYAHDIQNKLAEHSKSQDISYLLYPSVIFILVFIFYGIMSAQGIPINYYTSLGAIFVSGLGWIGMIIYHLYKKSKKNEKTEKG